MAEPNDRAIAHAAPAGAVAGVEAPASATDAPGDPARRQLVHEANNRLAAVIMNLAFARATLSTCPAEQHLTPLERSDLATALEHAEAAAHQLAAVVRQMG